MHEIGRCPRDIGLPSLSCLRSDIRRTPSRFLGILIQLARTVLGALQSSQRGLATSVTVICVFLPCPAR